MYGVFVVMSTGFALALTLGGCGKRTETVSAVGAIGTPAPEIDGEDADGIRFKLSDYRGKVVMLDFWGHW